MIVAAINEKFDKWNLRNVLAKERFNPLFSYQKLNLSLIALIITA